MVRREKFGSISFSNSKRLPKISMTARVKGQSGHVPGGARQTGDKPAAHRIAGHDDWDGRGRVHGSNRAWIGPGRDDDIDPSRTRSAVKAGNSRRGSNRSTARRSCSYGMDRDTDSDWNSVIICYVAARYAEVGSRRPNSWVPYVVRLIRVPATKRVRIITALRLSRSPEQ